MAGEDLIDDYLDTSAGFGELVVVAGRSINGVYDSAAVLEADNGVISRAPTLRIDTADVSGVANGAVVTVAGVAHKVRQVVALPPDGALTQLVLVRT